MNPVHYSSKYANWRTPPALIEIVKREYPIELDVCATPGHEVCVNYIPPSLDGLSKLWCGRTCWMNPPYGRGIGRWVKKASDEAALGATVVCLLPARTDTRWWHEYIEPVLRGRRPGEVVFLKGRLRFLEADGAPAKHPAPFPSCLVVFKPFS